MISQIVYYVDVAPREAALEDWSFVRIMHRQLGNNVDGHFDLRWEVKDAKLDSD